MKMKKIKINFIKDSFYIENEPEAQRLFSKGFGKKNELTVFEALYLLEKEKIEIYNSKKILSFKSLMRKKLVKKEDYIVFKDLRNRGYRIETGLKYGFTFRVYEKVHKHAVWLVEPILEKETFKIKDFAGKNRIANSTKKKMLFAIVDSDKDVTYLEINWKKM